MRVFTLCKCFYINRYKLIFIITFTLNFIKVNNYLFHFDTEKCFFFLLKQFEVYIMLRFWVFLDLICL